MKILYEKMSKEPFEARVNVRGSKRTFKFLNDDDDGVQENSRKEDRKNFSERAADVRNTLRR